MYVNDEWEISHIKFHFIATRYHRQIPNQPFVVLTSHKNERYYLLVREDDDDCFKVM